MNEFKGTPGPWIVGGKEGNKLSVNADPYFVALVDDGDSQEANARLIAAAPELLEALLDLEARACVYVNTSKAKDAITKALGESK